MALALNDFSGAETGGLEETSATAGTPIAPTANPRSGARAYRLAAGDAIEFAPFAASAADRFGPVEVFGYQAWPNSGTDNGSALDLGTWGLAIGNTFTSNFARLPGG